MGEVSLNRALLRLDEVAKIVGEEWTQGVQQIRGALGKLGINDQVEVASDPVEERYGILVKFSKGSGTATRFGEFNFFETEIREGLVSEPIFYSSFNSIAPFAVFVHGLDPRPTHSWNTTNSLWKSAFALYRCRMQNEGQTDCVKERVVLQKTAQSMMIDKLFADTQAVWDKVTKFIAEGHKRDDSDSDLDVLDRIVLSYTAAKPVLRPTTLENAKALFAESQKLLKEFESSPALESFVFDEGDCTYDSNWRTCVLAGYSFAARWIDGAIPDNPGAPPPGEL